MLKSPNFSQKSTNSTGSYSSLAEENPINLSANKLKFNLQPLKQKKPLLELSVTPLKEIMKVSPEHAVSMPVMISLKSILPEMPQEMKTLSPGIDLICVIDRSQSMEGQKMECVKQTLLTLLDFLHPNDRLCLIAYNGIAQQLTHLEPINQQHQITEVISSIYTDGVTDIAAGLDLAIKVLQRRRTFNKIASIFLLSDGLDQSALKSVPILFETNTLFSVHTFGFGADHDPELMSSISNLRSGNFYYIEKLDDLSSCFIDAFGALVGTSIQNINIEVIALEQKYCSVQIIQVYGDKWKEYIPNKIYRMKLHQLAGGMDKNFIVEVKFSKCNQQTFGKDGLHFKHLAVSVKGQDVQTGVAISLKDFSICKLFTVNDPIGKCHRNKEVLEHYFRVQTAQTIDQARKLCDKQLFSEGQKILDEMINKLSKSNIQYPPLIEILKNTQNSCKENRYQSERIKMFENCQSQMYQQNSMSQKAYSCPIQQYYQQTLTLSKGANNKKQFERMKIVY